MHNRIACEFDYIIILSTLVLIEITTKMHFKITLSLTILNRFGTRRKDSRKDNTSQNKLFNNNGVSCVCEVP